MKNAVLLCVVLFSTTIVAQLFPRGWTYPSDPLFDSDWRKDEIGRYLECYADFDGNGMQDAAFVLQSLKGPGIGIFVILSDFSGKKEPICLYNSESDPTISSLEADLSARLQRAYRIGYGIRIVKPDIYFTSCAQGFRDCLQDEPEKIELAYPGICFFQHDAGYERYYYWDMGGKKFLTQMIME
jgi:hypothetical protein